MRKMKLPLTIFAAFVAFFWQVSAYAFTVACAPANINDEITLLCVTKWGLGDVLAYNTYTANTLAASLPPNAGHNGQKITADGVTISPNIVKHYISSTPAPAFYLILMESTFRGLFFCTGNDDGEPTVHAYSDTSLDSYGMLLSLGGNGPILGQ